MNPSVALALHPESEIIDLVLSKASPNKLEVVLLMAELLSHSAVASLNTLVRGASPCEAPTFNIDGDRGRRKTGKAGQIIVPLCGRREQHCKARPTTRSMLNVGGRGGDEKHFELSCARDTQSGTIIRPEAVAIFRDP